MSLNFEDISNTMFKSESVYNGRSLITDIIMLFYIKQQITKELCKNTVCIHVFDIM